MTVPSPSLFVSPSAAARLSAGVEWLVARGPTTEVLVVGHTVESARELCHAAAERAGASFGWYRTSFSRLAHELAPTGERPVGAPLDRLGSDAMAARAVHELSTGTGDVGDASLRLGRYTGVRVAPGFIRVLTGGFAELRLGDLGPGDVERVDPDLASLLGAYETLLDACSLSDRAGLAHAAVDAVERNAHPWVGLPVLFHDVVIDTAVEGRLARALIERAPRASITIPAGDERTHREWTSEGIEPGSDLASASNPQPGAGVSDGERSVERLQAHLFERDEPPQADLDETVTLFSAPGEGRECVEIARQLLQFAAAGTPFDRAAILLRSPHEYRPHLEEALSRAEIPAYFARGARRPQPAGRAFLALLRCRLEGFSAVRFAEYVSIGQVAGATAEGEPPGAASAEERWVPSDELPPERYGLGGGGEAEAPGGSGAEALGGAAGESEVMDSSPRVPRRWEKLIVDAAVVGGLDRWRRRLDGLGHELDRRLAALENEDDPATEGIQRQIDELAHLRDYALPLLEEMDRWPHEAAWSMWLDALGALATRALSDPRGVLEILGRLAPLGPVGPVSLAEVARVLRPHLLEVTRPPEAGRYGKVFVGAIEEARGRSFDVVFVPGLADHLFPRPVNQEPILSDATREALGLSTTVDQVAHEQFLLRLAVGAASERVVLSFPRMDLARSRPRVPSYYALEAVRAGQGELPLMEEFQSHAAQVTQARLGWPGPEEPEQAIDAAEYDLAVLRRLFSTAPAERGAANYLLAVNPFLRRQLKGRLRRWHPLWTDADGLIRPGPEARAELDGNRPSERPYSATALQALAACPYKFYLYAIRKLRARDDPGPIEQMDPLQKGGLVHDIQFRTGRALEKAGLQPVTPANVDRALDVLERVLGDIVERTREKLCPAIPRVWEDEISRIRADLRRWIREAAREAEWTPWKFEFAFGLRPGHPGEEPEEEGEEEERQRDPDSRREPIPLDAGILLRGKIDLVEGRVRSARGADEPPPETLRITDYKTGRAWHARDREGIVIAGGEALQPVLYALAAEKLWPGASVVGGGLYYCTSDGGFERVDVSLDDEARRAAQAVAGALDAAFDDAAFEGPSFVARPKPNAWGRGGACDLCDFRPVCGPHELARSARKPPIAWLGSLRRER